MTAHDAVSTLSGHRHIVIRPGPWSFRLPVRTLVVIAAMVAILAVLTVIAAGSGTYPVAPPDVISVFTGSNTSFDRVVVLEWRMPRILTAILVGVALGLSGAIFQILTRNPLGSPDIIGVNTGAYTGALIAMVTFGGGYYATAVGALIGGIGVAVVAYLLAYQQGLSGFKLIVVGIAVSAVLSSVNQWIIIKIDLHAAVAAAVWSQGTLNGITWAQSIPMAACLVASLAALAVLGLRLPVLQIGDDGAGGLGVDPDRTRVAYLVVGVALVAVAAAATGPISFVALAAPQIARQLTHSAGIALFPSAALGAVLLLGSDVIAQRAFQPTELPVGAVTICLGGAYLVYLLIKNARRI